MIFLDAACAAAEWRLVRGIPPPNPTVYEFGVFVDIHSGMVVASGINATDEHFSMSAFTFSATGNDPPRELVPIGRPDTNAFAYTAISADRILIGDDEDGNTSVGAAYLFDRSTGEQIARLTAPDGVVGLDWWFGQEVALTPEHAFVVGAAFRDRAVYVYSAEDGQFINKLTTPSHQNSIWSMTANSQYVLVGDSLADRGYLFDIATGDIVRMFNGGFNIDVGLSDQFAVGYASSPGNQAGVVSVFDVHSGMLLYTIELAGDQRYNSIDMDDRHLIVGGQSFPDMPTRVFDLLTGAQVGELPGMRSVAIHDGLAVLGPEFFQQQHVLVYQLVPEPGGLAVAVACGLCAGARLRRRMLRQRSGLVEEQ